MAAHGGNTVDTVELQWAAVPNCHINHRASAINFDIAAMRCDALRCVQQKRQPNEAIFINQNKIDKKVAGGRRRFG